MFVRDLHDADFPDSKDIEPEQDGPESILFAHMIGACA